MMGDGANDAPALAQADIGVAMNSDTQAAKEAGNMVDLDSDPAKLTQVIEIGKQLLMTRGALTTFSIANDVAKYFAIVPGVGAGTERKAFLQLAVARQLQLERVRGVVAVHDREHPALAARVVRDQFVRALGALSEPRVSAPRARSRARNRHRARTHSRAAIRTHEPCRPLGGGVAVWHRAGAR
jgi:hypothetical protein